MQLNYLKTCLKTAVLLTTVLLLGAGLAVAQQQVSLTAAPTTTTLPDGTTVPMWGYTCTALPTGVTSTATCAALNPLAGTGWSPVVITVSTGQTLQINLTNSLTFANGNGVPTSLVIVGQLGGGLGTGATSTTSPTHNPQTLTWPAGSISLADGSNTPPTQGPRVQSFSTEVAQGATTSLTWTAPRPGTYLLESGTHPSFQGSMGLYGMVVVTEAPSATAALPATATTGCAYTPAGGTTCVVPYNADVDLLLSEIDSVQNNSVATAVNTAGFSETAVWSGKPGDCGDVTPGAPQTCYPPAVNYSPRYFLINGVAFDKTNSSASLFPASPATGVTGSVLVRLVNAGLRMHIPSIVGAQTTPAVVPTGTTAVAASGFSLVAEDGNPLPGVSRVQSEVFMAPGKTYDLMVNVPAAGGSALPIYDRQGSVSGNASSRDTGMLAYLNINGTAVPAAPILAAAVANPDTYNSVIAGQSLTVSDVAKGVIANDVNVYGVQVSGTAPAGLVLNPNGTFAYTGSPTSFTYCANGTTTVCASVTLGAATIEAASGITCTVPTPTYTSTVATTLSIKPPGVLSFCKDAAGYPLTVNGATSTTPLTVALGGGGSAAIDVNGGFTAKTTTTGSHTFSFTPVNSQGTAASSSATVTLAFPAPSNLQVTLLDGITKTPLPGSPQDYRWIIEEDRTFYVDPNCQANPVPAGCPVVTPQGAPAIFGTNFHTSYMPVVAEGCTGQESCEAGQSVLGVSSVCDVGNGVCRPGSQKTAVLPSAVVLDTTKRYYISVLPGDILDPGHDMGGAELVYVNGAWRSALTPSADGVQILVEPQQQQAAKISVFVFEDDHPLNGEHDASGGIDILAPNEAGLGGFNITIQDLAGMSGDSSGQMTYDQFNQPLSNALAGTTDPVTRLDACPVSVNARVGIDTGGGTNLPAPSDSGITGVIPVCPKYEADGTTLSPLAGQAVIENVPPGRYGIVATPAADRIARGEEWLQTNTLDGGKDLEAFIKTNEPAYFQEYGPAGYHVSIGFANPQWINDIGRGLCNGPGAPACSQTVTGKVTGARMSRTPDQRLYSSGTRDEFGYTQCYASLGSPDGEDFAFAKCQDDGTFTLANIPAGDWKVTIFDQWNDQIVDGISTPVRVGAANSTWCKGPSTNSSVCDMGDLGVHGWKNNLYTRTFIDKNGNGVSDSGEEGLALVNTNIRYKDGSISNFNSTDLEGYAGFNEVFPIFNWYVMETSSTRFKNTGTHVINDAGGPADASPACGVAGFPACGSSSLLSNLARSSEDFSLPTNLRIPGAVYCDNADCSGFSVLTRPSGGGPGGSTGRIDPPTAVSYGWQSYMGQNQYLEFGKKPFAPGENGGIQGHVVYASTRPFDDPQLLLQTSWMPQVPNVTINLYQEGTAADGVTQTLILVDTTTTSSWDAWAQGFRTDPTNAAAKVPNMSCPGQDPADLFFYALQNQPNYLDWYNAQHGGPAVTPLPYNSQYKCYDGMHNWNQLQPAPYDGMYSFPSVTSTDSVTGKPNGTNCTICGANPAAGDWNAGLPMLPAGKYVVEVIVPPGYELVKEEDKNLLTGDAFTAPVTQQFSGFGNIFIMPDQAAVASAYNPNNSLMPTTDQGVTPRHEGDTGSVEQFWPCVGAKRIVPDFLSINPAVGFNTPFAGSTRPLCDRKEVTLGNEMSVLAKFYIFSSAHIAAHVTGIITDDFTSEFDPFSPAFGEKFSPANLPVGIKDHSGNDVGRLYSDIHGIYNGLTYSSWTVNPPDPSGYTPQMFVMCMNDRGSGSAPDPFYQAAYSQFCYEWSMMPGQTSYLDTPVIPTAAFAANYNHPDCAYPDGTPAISEVDGDGVGPWVNQPGNNITITALGDQVVNDYAYSGPSTLTAPWNQKTITRHYGFGARCTAPTPGSATCNTLSTVSVGVNPNNGNPILATIVSWGDTQIVATVPANLPDCAIQQQVQYGNPNTTGAPGQNTTCGQLVITAGNGKKSTDTVTVTVRGKTPTHVAASASIQAAIDAASPGDLIIVDPTCMSGTGPTATPVPCAAPSTTNVHSPSNHHEMVIMWKPVRLQGVGAASTIIDANAHPSGILNNWRERVVCLFGIGKDGVPGSWDPSCGSGWVGFSAGTNNPQVDRIPAEATVGWDATLNGNLAEQLQEPSLMGAYEGAGITVLSKGVDFHGANAFDDTAEGAFPDGTTFLLDIPGASSHCSNSEDPNPFPSNFQCNPSSIDGLSITNSSQGGGGIFVHAWAHNLEIANNRVFNNQGTLAGGISVGQGEFPPQQIQGAALLLAPGSCQFSNIEGRQLPYCHNLNVNVHHNAVTSNASEGDELFSATPSGAGGVAFCSGADNYRFNYNWVCGNLSTGDGSGVAQAGFVYNAAIAHNTILFNQSTNPTIPSNGGGLLIMQQPDTDPTCPGEPDADCSHAYGTVGDGIGPGLVIDANLIIGNAAEAGSGGGIRFQGVNGVEVGTFPNTPSLWYSVNVTNNIIVNNVAGWDGGGISLQDSIGVNLINNTIVSNDSTASSGTLFGAFFAPQASSPTPCARDVIGANLRCVPLSNPQPAGVSAGQHTAEFLASLPASITCPPGHPLNTSSPNVGVINGACRNVSWPELYNNVLWQNRAFHIDVVQPASGSGQQQATVTLVPQLNQTSTGACVTTGANYWDLGLRGDTGPANHSSGYTWQPKASVLTSTTGYPGGPTGFAANTSSFSPGVAKQYCNGSKIPPEAGKDTWYQVPPGTNEGNVPTPVFSLTAGATVDEGNNWVNINWGPLSLITPTTETNPATETMLGNYSLAAGSPAINYITTSSSSATYAAAPSDDFYGNSRKGGGNPGVDAGAVEFTPGTGGGSTSASVSPTSLNFGPQTRGTTSFAKTITVSNTGTTALAGGTFTFGGGTPQPFARATALQGGPGTCGVTLAVGSSCTFNVVFSPVGTTADGTVFSRTLTVAYTGATVTGSPVALTGTAVARGTGSLTFTAATNGTLTTVLGVRTLTFTIPTPRAPVTSTVTLTNGGPAGSSLLVSADTLSINIGGLYSLVAPASGTPCVFPVTLASGASCTVGIQYATPATLPGAPDIGAFSAPNNGAPVTNITGTLALSAQ